MRIISRENPRKRMLEHWNGGIVGNWNNGMLEGWKSIPLSVPLFQFHVLLFHHSATPFFSAPRL